MLKYCVNKWNLVYKWQDKKWKKNNNIDRIELKTDDGLQISQGIHTHTDTQKLQHGTAY